MSVATTQPADARTGGFTILELIFALVIFAVGSLALAGLSLTLERQTTSTNLRTERSAAAITALERIRAMDFDSVANGAASIGHYQATWTVADAGRYAKSVSLVTQGPAYVNSGGSWLIAYGITDTTLYQVTAP